MAVKKPLIVELSEEILRILGKEFQETNLSEFDIARASSLITKAEKIHPALGHSFRACLCCVTGKHEKSLYEHEIAMSLEPDNTVIALNCAATLFRLGKFEETLELTLSVLGKDKGNISAASRAPYAAYHCGDARLPFLLDAYKTLTGETHEVDAWLAEDIEDEADIPGIIAEAKMDGYIPWEKAAKELGL